MTATYDGTRILKPAAGPSRASNAFTLHVVSGPDQGRMFEVDARQPCRLLVGTSVSAHIRLNDDAVSRRHASIDNADRLLVLRDEGSTNGTFVNGVMVTEAYLAGAEHVRVGSTTLRVDLMGPANVSPPIQTHFGAFIGASLAIRRLYGLVDRLAQANVPIVIEGETGTGKEVLAEAIHERSPRASGPFVVFDCTTVPGPLLESALFGHEKGAFTGAAVRKVGMFELAGGGTIFIDEIGELELSLQPKLLRAIQRSEIQRVGGDRWIKSDIRVIAATRRNLDQEVQAGRFRDDLFFRLAVGRIELPPLRQRQGDIRLLATHFWKKLDSQGKPIPESFLERLEDYRWPGNVRELETAVVRFLVLGTTPQSEAGGPTDVNWSALDDVIACFIERRVPLGRARQLLIDAFEASYLTKVLDQNDGNVTRAADAAGLGRRHMHTLLAKAGFTNK